MFQPNTRWRFHFRASELKGPYLYYAFNIFTVPDQQCLETTYRPGKCCDSTVESIQLAIATQFKDRWWQLVPRYWLFDVDGSTILSGKTSTGQWGQLGLNFKDFNRNTTEVPPGTELVLTLQVNATLWSDPDQFPCGQSHLVDEAGICDFILSGKQVFDGQLVMSPFDDYVPGCCPEGVFTVTEPTELCGCADNKEESPYRLTALPDPESLLMSTVHHFRIDAVTPAPPQPGAERDCNDMDLDRIRLYVRPEALGQITAVRFEGITVPLNNVIYESDGKQHWIEIRELRRSLPPTGTFWMFDITVRGMVPSLCAPNALGTGSCEYVLYGEYNLRDLDFNCCAHGYSEAVTVEPEPEQCDCDTNVLHTPYRLDFAQLFYNEQVAITRVAFTLTYDKHDCDEWDPMNGGCCATDLKSVYMEVDTKDLLDIDIQPPVQGLIQQRLSDGVKLVGLWGKGAGYDVTLRYKGAKSLGNVCKPSTFGEGCNYRLEGGFNINQPFGCCPQYSTGI